MGAILLAAGAIWRLRRFNFPRSLLPAPSPDLLQFMVVGPKLPRFPIPSVKVGSASSCLIDDRTATKDERNKGSLGLPLRVLVIMHSHCNQYHAFPLRSISCVYPLPRPNADASTPVPSGSCFPDPTQQPGSWPLVSTAPAWPPGRWSPVQRLCPSKTAGKGGVMCALVSSCLLAFSPAPCLPLSQPAGSVRSSFSGGESPGSGNDSRTLCNSIFNIEEETEQS